MNKELKTGYYIQLNGIEYQLDRYNSLMGAVYELLSDNADSQILGFQKRESKTILTVSGKVHTFNYDENSNPVYVKKIDPSEISEVYSYSTYWLYKGQYRVMTYSDEEWFNDQPTCRIIANDYALAQKEGFETFMGQGEYIGTVKKSDLELVEVKKLANDFVR